MPKYSVWGKVVGTKYIGEYEAENATQAEAMAWKDAHSSLCRQCSDECEDPEIDELTVELSVTESST